MTRPNWITAAAGRITHELLADDSTEHAEYIATMIEQAYNSRKYPCACSICSNSITEGVLCPYCEKTGCTATC